jgi:vacuolar-type H+-ATPase subunit D/Vma8
MRAPPIYPSEVRKQLVNIEGVSTPGLQMVKKMITPKDSINTENKLQLKVSITTSLTGFFTLGGSVLPVELFLETAAT